MGASSVTGVGIGSAEGASKGSERMKLGVNHLIGPHIVAAGNGTLSGGALSIEIPVDSSLALTDLGVMALPTGSTAHAMSCAMSLDTTNSVLTLAFHGTSTDTFSWAVFTVGIS